MKENEEGKCRLIYYGSNDLKITFDINMLYMTTTEFIENIKYFMSAIGYLPQSINDGLKENIDDDIKK